MTDEHLDDPDELLPELVIEDDDGAIDGDPAEAEVPADVVFHDEEPEAEIPS